ncbi:MAG: DMT family transporter, partial [Albidovulum sp.]
MDFRSILMGLAFAFMWSSAFTSARMIVADAPPMTALSVRFLISGLIGVGIAAALGQSWRLSRGQWRSVMIFGLCQNALYLGLNFVAMQWIEASLAAIIASTMPLLVALLGWLFMGQRIRPLGIAGLIAGVIGVAIIMGSRFSGGVSIPGILFCGVGALALAVATLTVRGASGSGNVLMIVGLQMFVGAALLAVVAIATERGLPVHWTPRLGLAFAYTTLVPGLVATWVWFR